MTEADRPRADGGPLLGANYRGGSPAVVASAPPNMVGPHVPANAGRVATDATTPAPDHRFSRTARSPLPYGVIAVAAVGIAVVAVRRAIRDGAGQATVAGSELWIDVTSVLVPLERFGPGHRSLTSREYLALALVLVAFAAVTGWIARIGYNLKLAERPFGTLLSLGTIPAWWVLPIVMASTASDYNGTYAERLGRLGFALVILIGAGVLRAVGVARIWRAGHLPAEQASLALSLPALVPWAMFLGSGLTTLIAVGDDGTGHSGWVPTQAMLDWALWLQRASGVGLFALLAVVSVRQHLGIRQDRAELEAFRNRLA